MPSSREEPAGNLDGYDAVEPPGRKEREEIVRSFFAVNAHQLRKSYLDPERAAEPSGGIVRFGAIVIHEDVVVAPVGKDSAAKFSNGRRRY